MLCILWNFEGPLYWELFTDDHDVDGKLYSEPLELFNQKHVILQHDNVLAHKFKVVHKKLTDLKGIDVMPNLAYSPDLVSLDFYLFRSISHFISVRHFYKIKKVEDVVRDFLASKPPEWYKIGIQKLSERWTKTVTIYGLYFEKDS